jgi:zinc transport system ATP-binding protein
MEIETISGPKLISAQRVTVRYGGRPVLDGVDLSVAPGEIVTLIGPNGSGKTTFLRAVLGLIRPDQGDVEQRPGLTIGYVPQRVEIDRTLPLTLRRFVMLGGGKAAQLDAAAREVGIRHLLDRSFHDLSGGEAKRALLARALLREPDLLVLDEPTANVDVAGQAEFYDLIRRIRDRRGCGVLLVSHDLHLVMAATDHVVCLNTHVCCSGRPESVTRNPEYLALFGHRVAETHGLYTHVHDHSHGISGEPTEDVSEHAQGEHVHG